MPNSKIISHIYIYIYIYEKVYYIHTYLFLTDFLPSLILLHFLINNI